MSETNKEVQIVSNFLEASMAPDPVRAASRINRPDRDHISSRAHISAPTRRQTG